MNSTALLPILQTAGRTLAYDAGTTGWLDGRWWEQLQPGSWRGVGFVMDAGETRAGRRIALHEYPFSDTVWGEDLGRLPRRFAFQAFLVGDDVYQQRNAMLAACEQAGPGTLVHPTLGSLECVLLEFSTTDRRDRGRVVEIAFQFVASAELAQPGLSVATGAEVGRLADRLYDTAGSDLARTWTAAPAVPGFAGRSVDGFAGLATAAGDDPARALGAAAGLPGFYGRFAAGRRQSMLPAGSTLATALSRSIASRSQIAAAASRLTAAAAAL